MAGTGYARVRASELRECVGSEYAGSDLWWASTARGRKQKRKLDALDDLEGTVGQLSQMGCLVDLLHGRMHVVVGNSQHLRHPVPAGQVEYSHFDSIYPRFKVRCEPPWSLLQCPLIDPLHAT